MQRIVFILSFFICISLFSFAQDFQKWSYLSECVDVSQTTALQIKITAFDKSKKTEIELLKKYAVHTILFKGVAGASNCVSQPPLLLSDQGEKNTDYINNLLGKKGNYHKYIVAAENIESSKIISASLNESYRHSVIVTINKELLKNDLLKNKVIAPLNNGF